MVVELKLKEVDPHEFTEAVVILGDDSLYKFQWLDENGVWHDVRKENLDKS